MYIHIHARTYLNPCTYIYIYICIYLYLHIYICRYVHLSMCRSTYLSIYISIYPSIYVSIYLPICRYTHRDYSELSCLCNFPVSLASILCGIASCSISLNRPLADLPACNNTCLGTACYAHCHHLKLAELTFWPLYAWDSCVGLCQLHVWLGPGSLT